MDSVKRELWKTGAVGCTSVCMRVCVRGDRGGFSVYVSARTHGNHVFVHVLQERKGLGLWGIRRKCARARATAGGAKGTVQGGSIFSSSFINLYITIDVSLFV